MDTTGRIPREYTFFLKGIKRWIYVSPLQRKQAQKSVYQLPKDAYRDRKCSIWVTAYSRQKTRPRVLTLGMWVLRAYAGLLWGKRGPGDCIKFTARVLWKQWSGSRPEGIHIIIRREEEDE